MIIALILKLLFGSVEDAALVFSVSKIEKEIRHHVADDSRKDALLLIVKDSKKELKEFNKEKKRILKKLNKISKHREITSKSFLEVFDEYLSARVNMISSLIDYRLAFQQQITEPELTLIIKKASTITEKESRKNSKREEKADEKLTRIFQDINRIVVKNIEDINKREIIMESINEFEKTILIFADEVQEMTDERIKLLSNINASREELSELYVKNNQLHYKVYRDYAQTRDIIIENTNDKEWKAIYKELKVFLK